MPEYAFWVLRDTEKTILHLHGVTKDSMATVMDDALDDDTGTFNSRTATVGSG